MKFTKLRPISRCTSLMSQGSLPQSVEPNVTTSQAMDPNVMTSQLVEPDVTTSQLAEPDVMISQLAEPEAMESQTMEPQTVEPNAMEYHVYMRDQVALQLQQTSNRLDVAKSNLRRLKQKLIETQRGVAIARKAMLTAENGLKNADEGVLRVQSELHKALVEHSKAMA